MTCHDTKDNAGLIDCIPVSKTNNNHNNNRIFSFLCIVFYWKNDLKLCFSLADTGVKSLPKILNYHKRATPVFIQRFINRRPHFTPVSAEVSISFEKLTSHPNLKEKLLFGKAVKIENCAACHDQS